MKKKIEKEQKISFFVNRNHKKPTGKNVIQLGGFFFPSVKLINVYLEIL